MNPLCSRWRTDIDWVALIVLIVLFAVVTVLGFMAARFKQGDTLDSLDEWGLGGRKFGTWITWFLLGGDLYTAYTFIAVPAAMFATGRSPASSRCPTRSSSTRSSSSSWRGCGRSATATATSPPPTSSAGATTPGSLARGRGDRVRRDDALHRPPAGRHRGSPRGRRARGQRQLAGQGPAAAGRVRAAGGVHLHLGAACAGGDRVRQGRPDLPGDHRRDRLPAPQVRWLGRTSSAPPRPR